MRGKGEGSIYRRSDGYWVGSVEAGRYPNGRRRRLRVVRRYRADVVDALDKLRREVAEGVTPDRTRTVHQYLAWWLDEVATGSVTDSSLREYRKRVARVTPAIGHVKLGKLTSAHVQELANRLVEQYPRSPATRASTLETLRRALRWAVGANILARNPAEHVKNPRTPTAKVDDVLTADEAKKVLAVADDDLLIWLALKYGLRLGELLDLRWSDVDLKAAEMTVRRSKTAAGVRTLPLIPEAERRLRAARQLGGYVFPAPQGGRRKPDVVRDRWNALLRTAGVGHRCRNCGTDDKCTQTVRRFHVSRHTAATLLLEAGVQLEVVSAILGHANIGITAGIYAKVRSDLKRKGMSRLEGGA